MKKLIIPFLLFLGISLYAQNFEWNLGLMDNRQGTGLDFSRPVKLDRGDIISILMQSDFDCWLYIIVQDAERNVAIFHNGLIQAGNAYRSNPVRILPPDGQDTIHIIVSRDRERALEERISVFERNDTARNGWNLINAVMDLRREILRLSEAPEKPVQLGGTFRTIGEIEGRNYSGSYRYSKTILISH